MKKKVLMSLVTLSLVGMLAGCGTDTVTDSKVTDTPTPTEAVVSTETPVKETETENNTEVTETPEVTEAPVEVETERNGVTRVDKNLYMVLSGKTPVYISFSTDIVNHDKSEYDYIVEQQGTDGLDKWMAEYYPTEVPQSKVEEFVQLYTDEYTKNPAGLINTDLYSLEDYLTFSVYTTQHSYNRVDVNYGWVDRFDGTIFFGTEERDARTIYDMQKTIIEKGVLDYRRAFGSNKAFLNGESIDVGSSIYLTPEQYITVYEWFLEDIDNDLVWPAFDEVPNTEGWVENGFYNKVPEYFDIQVQD